MLYNNKPQFVRMMFLHGLIGCVKPRRPVEPPAVPQAHDAEDLEELLDSELAKDPAQRARSPTLEHLATHSERGAGPKGDSPGAVSVAAVPSELSLPTSKTHKKQWRVLERAATGPRAKALPQLAAMWGGSVEDKRRALQQFLQSNENLDATEAAMVITRRKKEKMNLKRRWMTIRDMHDAKFSQQLGEIQEASSN